MGYTEKKCMGCGAVTVGLDIFVGVFVFVLVVCCWCSCCLLFVIGITFCIFSLLICGQPMNFYSVLGN
jgi:hypothetical protein